MVLFNRSFMNVHALTRSLTLVLVAALALVGVIHILACDHALCAPDLTARSHPTTLPDVCSLSICPFLAISTLMLGLNLAFLPGQLSESVPILSTVSLPHIVPPPRSA